MHSDELRHNFIEQSVLVNNAFWNNGLILVAFGGQSQLFLND